MFQCILLCCALALAFAGRGQTNAPVDLGTIVVEGTPVSKYRTETVSTATFAAAKPEELPLTVDVLTEDFIDEMNPTDLHDLLRYEPGIYTGGKSVLDVSAGTYTMRGKGGSEAMLDGTLPLAGPMGIFMDPTAFERIELVKGPVGSTVGGQTGGTSGSGGSVNLILKQPRPDLDFMTVTTRATLGEDLQRYRFGFDINERVVADRLTVRLPGNVEYGKPFWMPDSYRWRESFYLAPSLLWEVRDDLRIGFTLTFQYTDQPGYQGIPMYQGKPYQCDWDSDFSTSRMRDIYIGHTVQSYVEWDASEVWTFRTGAGVSQADVEFEHMGAASFANLSRTPATNPKYGTLLDPLTKPYDHQEGDMLHRRYNVYQRAVASFDTGPVAHQMVFQGDYSEKRSQGKSYFGATADRYEKSLIRTKDSTGSEVSKAGIFAQDYLSWRKFRLLGGYRIDEHENNNGDTGEAYSPRAGLAYLPTDGLVFFGNVSWTESPNLGYRRNERDYLISDWKATQYETGVRVSPVATVWLSASVFQIRQENMPTLQEGSTLYYEEEGKNKSEGVELSLTGNLADNWSVFAAYAYIEYEDQSPNVVVRKFDRYPPHALTASTSYRIASGPFDDIVLGFGYRYRHKSLHTMRGSYIGGDFYSGDSHVFDCSADIPLRKFGGPKNVTLSLACKNIFNERYIESNRHYYQCFPGDPRTLEIALQAKF
ncbi:MAG: TonB-dependent receptor [Kiritimatiellia bacterium]|jgi:outer membrane receptor protein involved in Fe transport|nr:TonB-dependent receptor [Kiritimatiellia bacterium]